MACCLLISPWLTVIKWISEIPDSIKTTWCNERCLYYHKNADWDLLAVICWRVLGRWEDTELLQLVMIRRYKSPQTAVILLNITHLCEILVLFCDFPSSQTGSSLDKSRWCSERDQAELLVLDRNNFWSHSAGWMGLGHHFLIFKKDEFRKYWRKKCLMFSVGWQRH